MSAVQISRCNDMPVADPEFTEHELQVTTYPEPLDVDALNEVLTRGSTRKGRGAYRIQPAQGRLVMLWPEHVDIEDDDSEPVPPDVPMLFEWYWFRTKFHEKEYRILVMRKVGRYE